MLVESVKNSKRLLAITQAVNPIYLEQLNRIDWLSRDWVADSHWQENSTFRRRILSDHCDLMQAIDTDIAKGIPEINRLCCTNYTTTGSVWHICEPRFECPMHTDGFKPNVMIIFWHAPGPGWGTTFYNSDDEADVLHEFTSIPNTGFFAYYEPESGEPWPCMWHASLKAVPADSYRLLTQYEFQR
jgi:hypothetical protein